MLVILLSFFLLRISDIAYYYSLNWVELLLGEPLALDCLGWDSEGLYLLVGDCNSLSNARLLTPHSLLFSGDQ